VAFFGQVSSFLCATGSIPSRCQAKHLWPPIKAKSINRNLTAREIGDWLEKVVKLL